MSSWYDSFAQWLLAAPMMVQVVVVLLCAIPVCGVIGVIVVRAIDFVAVGFRARSAPSDSASVSEEDTLRPDPVLQVHAGTDSGKPTRGYRKWGPGRPGAGAKREEKTVIVVDEEPRAYNDTEVG